MAETWHDIGRDCRKAAPKLVREEHFRSAASRAYYAVFSKVTQDLIAGGLPPHQGEGFRHARIRKIIITSMPDMEAKKRRALSYMMGRLYTLRIDADYKPSITFDATAAREAVSIMNKVFQAF